MDTTLVENLKSFDIAHDLHGTLDGKIVTLLTLTRKKNVGIRMDDATELERYLFIIDGETTYCSPLLFKILTKLSDNKKKNFGHSIK